MTSDSTMRAPFGAVNVLGGKSGIRSGADGLKGLKSKTSKILYNFKYNDEETFPFFYILSL